MIPLSHFQHTADGYWEPLCEIDLGMFPIEPGLRFKTLKLMGTDLGILLNTALALSTHAPLPLATPIPPPSYSELQQYVSPPLATPLPPPSYSEQQQPEKIVSPPSFVPANMTPASPNTTRPARPPPPTTSGAMMAAAVVGGIAVCTREWVSWLKLSS